MFRKAAHLQKYLDFINYVNRASFRKKIERIKE